MKNINKQAYLKGATFFVLILLVIIQVNWILKAARMEEQNFNHRVNMALKRTRYDLSESLDKCVDMQNFLCGKQCPVLVRKEKIRQVDSILQTNLAAYDIQLKYTFKINQQPQQKSKSFIFKPKYYLQSLNGLLEKNDIHISLQFPGRNQFILAQIGGMFLLSILFILFVMASFFIIFRLYRKEKLLSGHTRDFINNMVHEFQTPLSNIGFATNLLRKKSSEELDDYTRIIINEKSKMQRHVEEILQIACLDNQQKITPEKIDIHQLLEELSSRFTPKITDSGGKVTLELTAARHHLQGYKSHLCNALSNILDNAVKYTNIPPLLHISSSSSHDYLTIIIDDNGIGIPDKDLPYIFDKYYRVSTGDVHNVKGFGLGLTYVKKVVEQHNGTVVVTSRKGHGTQFKLTFPIKHEPQ